jgi:hypothetical protein
MKIDGEDIESLLANMMLEKNFKSHISDRTTFAYIFIWQWAKQISH